jgi:flagellin
MDQMIRAYIGTMTAAGLGIRTAGAQVSISSPDEANKTIGTIDAALTKVNRQRADLGAYQNRMENTVQGVAIAAENTQAAESRIRDTDMAEEMVDYVKNQILVRSGTAMLAQANLLPQTVLELLR